MHVQNAFFQRVGAAVFTAMQGRWRARKSAGPEDSAHHIGWSYQLQRKAMPSSGSNGIFRHSLCVSVTNYVRDHLSETLGISSTINSISDNTRRLPLFLDKVVGRGFYVIGAIMHLLPKCYPRDSFCSNGFAG